MAVKLKEMFNDKKNILIASLSIVLILGVLTISLFVGIGKMPEHKMQTEVANMKLALVAEEHYSCCLNKPCSYCLLTEGSCDCLEEVMNGEHPCGECMGEILEGKGNSYVAKYFARALSDELGEQYHDTLKEIISQKYNIPVEGQA